MEINQKVEKNLQMVKKKQTKKNHCVYNDWILQNGLLVKFNHVTTLHILLLLPH